MRSSGGARCSGGRDAVLLSSLLLLLFSAFCVSGVTLNANSTGANSSDVKWVGLKPAMPADATPISLTRVHSRKPRHSEEPGRAGRLLLMDTSVGLDLTSRRPLEPRTTRKSFADSENLQADGTPIHRDSPGSPPQDLTHPHLVPEPPAWFQKLQGGDPTSWTLSDFYDYLSPEYSPTDLYPDESQPTPPDMEDENVPLVTTPLPEGGSGDLGSYSSGCLVGFVRRNGSCVSACSLYSSYCLNGGQCYVLEGVGAYCRCNVQEFLWNKGSRCESVISNFQVLCIAVGGASLMMLLLFMVIVCFTKKLYLLKVENRRLRKRSKYTPPPEPHTDNFSLSTVAEGSQANVRKLCETPTNLPHVRTLPYYDNLVCQDDAAKDEPAKSPSKEDESLTIQNSLSPKLDDEKEEQVEEGGVTIDLELLLPKEAKMHPETSPPLQYNVFLYKLPKSQSHAQVTRPRYSPVSTRSLPAAL